MKRFDVLLIGSGIGGLFTALKIADKHPDRQILILTKDKLEVSNTRYAQGGIAVVMDLVNDSHELHMEDTLKAGGGLSNKEVVEFVVKNAAVGFKDLLSYGVTFTKDERGNPKLGLEGGHSANRIAHYEDLTGLEIELALIKKIKEQKNIHYMEFCHAIDLAVNPKEPNEVIGVHFMDLKSGMIDVIFAEKTILATGGCGQLYQNTTNPVIATGDGVAMASRAEAKIENMEYIQFHPTALFEKNLNPLFLISEAVRGFGAHIVDEKGIRFLLEECPMAELATRDVVSTAIVKRMQQNKLDHVFLDLRHLDMEEFKEEFPNIYLYCKEKDLDLSKDLIPIAPAAHYQCGGITVDKTGKTSLNNLYAVGECSNTGLHGKNRLASNSLLEAVVYGMSIAENISFEEKNLAFENQDCCVNYRYSKGNSIFYSALKNEIKANMSNLCGVSTSLMRLKNAVTGMNSVNKLLESRKKEKLINEEWLEISNMVAVSILIINARLKDFELKDVKI